MELSALEIDGLLSYWDQTMPESEQAEIAERLRTDGNFRRAANETQLVVYAVRAARSAQTRDYLTQLRGALPPLSEEALLPPLAVELTPALGKKPFWQRHRAAMLALAAAFAGILVVWTFGPWSETAPQGTDWASSYFKSAHGLTRKSGDETSEYRQALLYCVEGEYTKAIPIFKRQFNMEHDTMLLLQIGVAAYGAGQLDQASENLEIARQHVELKTKASWFLALVLLEQQQDKNRAVRLLRELEAEGGDYGRMAADKLKTLR